MVHHREDLLLLSTLGFSIVTEILWDSFELEGGRG